MHQKRKRQQSCSSWTVTEARFGWCKCGMIELQDAKTNMGSFENRYLKFQWFIVLCSYRNAINWWVNTSLSGTRWYQALSCWVQQRPWLSVIHLGRPNGSWVCCSPVLELLLPPCSPNLLLPYILNKLLGEQTVNSRFWLSELKPTTRGSFADSSLYGMDQNLFYPLVNIQKTMEHITIFNG